ncbi:unnamed protein product [Eruca vesicaria subsp. sativa]|uniref:F-box domain-containing protein n=1 Tax=Eruca vesicaria subsp. sativa TaxID=29727 RepID=A0ABC8JQM8_ERUVS|nr:unnamed protein product [Eruca vesicaria subsp. sativa]
MDAKRFNCSRDSISSLPDEILSKILSLITSTKQAASTSILSKRWRYLFTFTLVDNLDLDDSDSQSVHDVFPESFKNFVDRTLLQTLNPINKLSLQCHVGKEDDLQKACVSRWITNAVNLSASELDLRIKDKGIHYLPPSLFASVSLVKLTIGTKLYLGTIPPNVSLPSLKTLFIDTVFFEYGDLCDVLLAGCPVLEELTVHHHDFSATPHTIASQTVKRLSVHYDSPFDVECCSFMSFDLPNLLFLEYSHCALSEYIQVNLESLVDAKLDLYPEKKAGERPDVTNLIRGMRHVHTLHLSPVSVDVIYCYCWDGLPVFNNLVSLSMGITNKQGCKLLAYLLNQSPKLETLIIQDLNYYTRSVPMPQNKVKMLHILHYYGTALELKTFLQEFDCLAMVQVHVAEAVEDNVQTKKDIMMLLGASLPFKCQFKVT